MKSLYAIIILLALLGCTYRWQSDDPVSPITYKDASLRKASSVGKLRRLALMPIELKPYRGQYPSSKQKQDAAVHYQDICAAYLTKEKGYEVIVLRGYRNESTVPDKGQLNDLEIEKAYHKWSNTDNEKYAASMIKDIGRTLNVDGILVIKVKESKPWGAIEGLMNIALMNLPLYYEMVAPDIGAWIYETSSGRLVWRKKQAVMSEEKKSGSDNDLIFLFKDMENAVPVQLIR